MSLLVAAVGAVAAALLDLTIAPYLAIGGAQPDFVLTFAVIWTVVAGIEGGLIWAFIGGLMIDFLAPRPLGSTAFTLLVCVGGAAFFSRLMGRARYFMPILAVFVFSIVNSLLFLVVYGALRGPIPARGPNRRRRPQRHLQHRDRRDRRSTRRLGDGASPARARPARLVSQSFLERPVSRRSALRFLAFAGLAGAGLGIEAVRLAYLQLVQGAEVAPRPDGLRIVPDAMPSARGLIYDRAGRPLVTNVATWSVKLRPADLKVPDRPGVVDRLSGLLGIAAADINTTIDSNPGSTFDLVRIATDVPETTARLISEEQANLPGVEVVVEAHREYPMGSLFSQILGYTGAVSAEELARLRGAGYLPDDWIGKTGVEATYESHLRGTYGTQNVERDASGRRVQVLETVQAPKPGSSIQLTIDTREQKLAQQALEWGIDAARLKGGVLIVMNPQTGEVLALVSLPTYDNNVFASQISNKEFKRLLDDPARPLINHAICEQYPPGSTYKLVTGTGALGDRKITPYTRIQTKAFLELGPYRYYEWNRAGFGAAQHLRGLRPLERHVLLPAGRHARHRPARVLGAPVRLRRPDRDRSARRGGRNRALEPVEGRHVRQAIYRGRDVPGGHRPGLRRRHADAAHHGVLRPRQRRQAAEAAGRSGGHRAGRQPRRPVRPEAQPQAGRSADGAPDMRRASRSVVTLRHTYNLVELPVKVAGKSGTAEFGLRDSQGRLPFHSWFVGFVPKDPVQRQTSTGPIRSSSSWPSPTTPGPSATRRPRS